MNHNLIHDGKECGSVPSLPLGMIVDDEINHGYAIFQM